MVSWTNPLRAGDISGPCCVENWQIPGCWYKMKITTATLYNTGWITLPPPVAAGASSSSCPLLWISFCCDCSAGFPFRWLDKRPIHLCIHNHLQAQSTSIQKGKGKWAHLSRPHSPNCLRVVVFIQRFLCWRCQRKWPSSSPIRTAATRQENLRSFRPDFFSSLYTKRGGGFLSLLDENPIWWKISHRRRRCAWRKKK